MEDQFSCSSQSPSHARSAIEQQHELHWLPCMIDYDGEAAVGDFFQVCESSRKGEEGFLEASFRGRRLVGEREGFEGTCQGVVVDASLHPVGKFDSVILWDADEREAVGERGVLERIEALVELYSLLASLQDPPKA